MSGDVGAKIGDVGAKIGDVGAKTDACADVNVAAGCEWSGR